MKSLRIYLFYFFVSIRGEKEEIKLNEELKKNKVMDIIKIGKDLQQVCRDNHIEYNDFSGELNEIFTNIEDDYNYIFRERIYSYYFAIVIWLLYFIVSLNRVIIYVPNNYSTKALDGSILLLSSYGLISTLMEIIILIIKKRVLKKLLVMEIFENSIKKKIIINFTILLILLIAVITMVFIPILFKQNNNILIEEDIFKYIYRKYLLYRNIYNKIFRNKESHIDIDNNKKYLNENNKVEVKKITNDSNIESYEINTNFIKFFIKENDLDFSVSNLKYYIIYPEKIFLEKNILYYSFVPLIILFFIDKIIIFTFTNLEIYRLHKKNKQIFLTSINTEIDVIFNEKNKKLEIELLHV